MSLKFNEEDLTYTDISQIYYLMLPLYNMFLVYTNLPETQDSYKTEEEQNDLFFSLLVGSGGGWNNDELEVIFKHIKTEEGMSINLANFKKKPVYYLLGMKCFTEWFLNIDIGSIITSRQIFPDATHRDNVLQKIRQWNNETLKEEERDLGKAGLLFKEIFLDGKG